MPVPPKIDVHHHVYPPEMFQVLKDQGDGLVDTSGWPLPTWTAEADATFSTTIGVGTSILSVTAPGPSVLRDPAAAANLAHSLNEYCARLRDADPSRYGFFASVPNIFDTASTLAEIRHALDTLNADGIVLFTRYVSFDSSEDVSDPAKPPAKAISAYLGNEAFAPIWAELDARAAVVFVHPTTPPDPRLANPLAPYPVVDFPHETTRTATDLILNNCMRRYPNVKIVLSHAGGNLPWLSERLSMVADMPFGASGPSIAQIREDARRFYFDVALSGNSIALPTLLRFAPPGHVLFGSDYPNAPAIAIRRDASFIDECEMDEETRSDVFYGAAVKLFPRLSEYYK